MWSVFPQRESDIFDLWFLRPWCTNESWRRARFPADIPLRIMWGFLFTQHDDLRSQNYTPDNIQLILHTSRGGRWKKFHGKIQRISLVHILINKRRKSSTILIIKTLFSRAILFELQKFHFLFFRKIQLVVFIDKIHWESFMLEKYWIKHLPYFIAILTLQQ